LPQKCQEANKIAFFVGARKLAKIDGKKVILTLTQGKHSFKFSDQNIGQLLLGLAGGPEVSDGERLVDGRRRHEDVLVEAGRVEVLKMTK
jgi:hypothetical protein